MAMSLETSPVRLTDELLVELNPEPVAGPDHEYDALPARPDDDADREDWLEYAVALGADRTFLDETTQHYIGEVDNGHYVEVPSLDVDMLKMIADGLGG